MAGIPYYAFVPVPPVPTGTVTDTVFPDVVKEDATNWYNCAGTALDPEKRKSVNVERSANAGAFPESTQVTVNAVPPGMLAPAAGTENLTSAQTKEVEASSERIALVRRIFVVCTLSAK